MEPDMTTILVSLIAKFWPLIVGLLGIGGGALFGWAKTKSADTKVAKAGQSVAEAQKGVAQAQAQAAAVGQSEAEANSAAAQAGANAIKEKTDAENDVNALPNGGAAQQLRDQWTRD